MQEQGWNLCRICLENINALIGVATYQLINMLPEEMKAMLPEPEDIVKRLQIFEEYENN